MSKIFVVDDELQYAEVLSESLSELGHQVTICGHPKEALQILSEITDESKKFDLILSDINMPELSGTDFFLAFKKLPINTSKFVLMTGHADIISVQKAYELGVDELLAKPFDFEILQLVVDYLLDLQDVKKNSGQNFFQISIQDFMLSSQSQYYLYLKINNKFVCVSKVDQEFTLQRLNNFISKGVKSIYLNSTDYAKYTDVQFTIADHIRQRPVDNAKKIKAYRHLISTVSQNAIVNALEPLSVQKSLAAFEGYTEMAFSNKQLSDMMVSVFSELPDQAERNAVVAVIAVSLANLWQWSSAKTQSRIVLGAMLCDVGLKDNPHLMTAKKNDLNRDEQKVYEEHPYVGYKLLSELGDVPDEVLQIVLQHHENGIGTGFPQKLSKQHVHSFAKLIHGVHEFVEVISHQKDKKNVKLAIDHLLLCQRKIVSEQVIKSLYLLFHVPVPAEIETLMLPDKSGRLI